MPSRRAKHTGLARKHRPDGRMNPTALSTVRIPNDKDVICAIAGTYLTAPDPSATLTDFHKILVANLVGQGFSRAGITITFKRMMNGYISAD